MKILVNKKGIMSIHYAFFITVGMTGFEPATT